MASAVSRSLVAASAGVLLSFATGCTPAAPARARFAGDPAWSPMEDDASRIEAAGGAPPCTETRRCRRGILVGGHAFEYYATHSPFVGDERIRRAVIVVHGVDGSATLNFETGVAATARAESTGLDPAAREGTLILSPRFPNEDSKDVADDAHLWKRAGWCIGDRTVTRPLVSSFTILDGIVRELVTPGRFPHLRTIVIAGHSAGGQLAQRYAAISRVAESAPHVHLRYVVANPSSFLYLNDKRPYFTPGPPGFDAPSGGGASERFQGAPSCPDRYDRYRYGLRELNNYAKAVGAATIIGQYPGRDVVYLAGALDRTELDCGASGAASDLRCQRMEDKNNQDLDASCPAMLQGADRHARSASYLRFLDTFFPGHHHRLVEVPGANHSSRAMFDSPEGVAVIFGDR